MVEDHFGRFKSSKDDPMRLYCNEKSAISLAHDLVQHDCTRHIEIDKHFVKEKQDGGLICTPYVSTNRQLAHILVERFK